MAILGFLLRLAGYAMTAGAGYMVYLTLARALTIQVTSLPHF